MSKIKKLGEDAIKKLLNEAYNKKAFTHCQIVVGNEEKIIFEYDINANKNYFFDLASITKVIATTMITLKLIEKGILNLSTTLGDIYDYVEMDKKQISIKHLLTHSAGFEPHFHIQDFTEKKSDVETIILTRPLISKVGENVHYSCIGFILLGIILEKLTRNSLADLTKIYVIEPLNMTSTTFSPLSCAQLDDIVPTETDHKTNMRLHGIVHDENARFLKIAGNAGLFSTRCDMIKFLRALITNKNAQGKTYLSKDLYDLMLTNHTSGKNEGRGLGVRIYQSDDFPGGDKLSIGSYGHTGFTGTSFFIDKTSNIFVVLLANRVYYQRSDNSFFTMRRQIHNTIFS